jgi:hypothetical protein
MTTTCGEANFEKGERAHAIEELNDALAEAEHMLIGLKMGVAAEVELEPEKLLLRITKVDRDWRLVIHRLKGDDLVRILNCNVAEKMLIAHALPALRKNMDDVYAENVEDVKRACRAVHAFNQNLTTLGIATPPED